MSTKIGLYRREIDGLECIHPATRGDMHAMIEEAAAERWGPGVSIGFPHARGMDGLSSVHSRDEWEHVGYVSAHTSGPACPVYRRRPATE